MKNKKRIQYATRRGAIVVMLLALTHATRSNAQSGKPADASREKVEQVTSHTEHKHTNKLINATSPYLLQHAHNPVDWHEWSEETLEKARREDKPIFLSIGYSACHWCHVMEHETFENEGTAAILNDNFVSIKVDREERPDIDEIYMQATQRMTGRGGWPMSVFMTPDGMPFYCGTYFPRDRFENLLGQIETAWRENRNQLLDQGSEIREYLHQWAAMPTAGTDLIARSTVDDGASKIAQYFDPQLGGMRSRGNKFPPSMTMDLFLRVHKRTGEANLLSAVEVTLTRMARGGIYDQLGGGICRYSTDPEWLVPHFEKMLYDQGLVSAIYVDAFQATKNPLFAATARGICDYVIDDLQSPGGGFYSTRDADSEGMEGKFYIWTVEQVTAVLGPEDGKLFCAYYDVTDSGNWFESRGHAPAGPKNILNVQKDDESFAKLHKLELADWTKRLAKMKTKMLAVRAKRVEPSLDDKILTAWNGLMIGSLAKAAQAFDEPRYADSAARAADFVLKELRRDGKLLRTHRDGQSRLTGYLSDYAFFIEGLLNLYEATFDPRWLNEAVALTDDQIKRFYDADGGAFFFTAADGQKLLARTKDANDGAIPSGNSVAALNLLRLAVFTGNKDYRAKAESIFRAFENLVERSPAQYERLLCAVDFYHDSPKEVAIVGSAGDPATRAMIRAVYDSYRPNKVVAFAENAAAATKLSQQVPLLKGKRDKDNKPTGYVCQNYTCKEPVQSPAELVRLLDK